MPCSSAADGSPGTGVEAFVKQVPGDPTRVRAEAAGLRWLATATAGGGCRVVEVLGERPGELRIERVAAAPPDRGAADAFGRALAVTHAAGAPAFGAAPPGCDTGWIAALPLPLGAWPTFGAFYAQACVLPYLRAALDRGAVTPSGATVIGEVCDRLLCEDAALCGPAEPPARLHGDLWSGNVLWSPAGAVLIDPAAHGGHRETDLAMLALFGLPHLSRVLAAYDDAAPLAAGWRDRVALHQLHPLLVHAVLFGGSYGAAAVDAARRALAV